MFRSGFLQFCYNNLQQPSQLKETANSEKTEKGIEILFFLSIMLQRKERNRWLGMKKLFFIIYIR